jgi:ABC-type branched-subunit amino acid transport system ATPase component
MNMLAAQGDPHLFGWYLGFAIASVVITGVVALVAALLQVARRIGLQAQMAVQGLSRAYDNTYPLRDLTVTEDIAASVTKNLNVVRQAMEG